MIVETCGENGNKEYEYKAPSKSEKRKHFLDLIEMFEDYAESKDFDVESIESDFELINEIYIRVDKRKDYYKIFHGIKLNEIREAALTAFWILKFKPFLIVGEEHGNVQFDINSGFAAYIILAAAGEYISRKYGTNKSFAIMDEEFLIRFKYSLKYWDLSKESLMMIAESLCEHTIFEGRR
ncbi:MAG: hypothetical protein NC293_13945 [Roseburia sp.]|nr:hypothetical protein [Roseburia sp.]